MASNPKDISHSNHDSHYIFAQNLRHDNFNSSSAFPNTAGHAGGMIGGNIDKDAGLGFGEGISVGIENLDSVIATESAFNGNIFEKLFDGNLSIFGLNKAESFAIKSLGVLTSLNSLSFAKQSNIGIKGKTSIYNIPEQG